MAGSVTTGPAGNGSVMRKKHVLLAVTGMSPQVVTETLYAIHRDSRPWPEEVRVITTAAGARKVREGLIERGYLARLCADYGRPVPRFDAEHILVVKGADGQPVDDARTLADHEALADFITRTVCDMTNRVEPDGTRLCLHASLAGGRKTMTFYLGYAMSLFARPDDCLSHVLVDAAYEGLPDFYYPTPYSCEISARDKRTKLDAALAQVTLADIPFIRHRDYLPGRFHHLREEVSFRSLVDLINLCQTPDRLEIILDDNHRRLLVCEKGRGVVTKVPMSPVNYIAYRMVIQQNQTQGDPVFLPSPQVHDSDLARLFVEVACKVLGLSFDPDAPLTRLIDTLAEINELHQTGLSARTLESLRVGMRRSFLSERMNEIRSALHQYLPEKLKELLEVRPLLRDGRKATQDDLERNGTRALKGAAYCTMLDAGQFRVRRKSEQTSE